MFTRQEALDALRAPAPEAHLVRHALATEAIMRALAARLGEDAEVWGLTGLLHDLDYPLTTGEPTRHGLLGAEMLAGQMPEEARTAIQAHNGEMTGVSPATRLDFALRCAETVTGLITTAALVRPAGMEGMEPKSLKKKMKDKAFAASVSRENIRQCAELGLELDEFLSLSIAAMASHADVLGLKK